MLIETGIAVTKESNKDIFVAAVSWFQFRSPDFPKKGLTLPYMKENMPAVVIVKGTDLQTTVNTACNRTIEKLLIKRYIHPESPPLINLIVKPSLKRKKFVIPHRTTKTHWLLTAAKRALEDWLRGVR